MKPQKPKVKPLLPKPKVPSKKGITHKRFFKVIFFNTINIILLIAFVYLLSSLPKTSVELRDLRNQKILAKEAVDVRVILSTLENLDDKIQVVSAHFADETGIVNFIDEIDNLKINGSQVEFSFLSGNPVKDKTGHTGLPFLIEIKGDKNQVGENLQKIQKLPFLIRPVDVELDTDIGEGKIGLNYGGFLYVQ